MRPRYIQTPADFAAAVQFGKTPESRTLEFKARYETRDPKVSHELRKDATAFANTLGGCLLIGVEEGEAQDGQKVAMRLCEIDVGRLVPWASDVLTKLVFPSVSFDTRVLTVPDANGQKRDIIALNIRPNSEGAVCRQNEEGSLSFFYRDDFGVKYLTPKEATSLMSSHHRRIAILVNELLLPKKRVHIVTPVLRDDIESIASQGTRLGSAMAQLPMNPLQLFQQADAIRQASRPERIESALADPSARVEEVGERQVVLHVENRRVTVPFGLIREVWEEPGRSAFLALDCEIIIRNEDGSHAHLRVHRG